MLICAAIASLTLSISSQSPEYDGARAWFLEIQQQAYDAVMPMGVADRLVTYRSYDEMHPDVPAD